MNSSYTVDRLQRRASQETSSREFRVSSARDMGNNLGPPAQDVASSWGQLGRKRLRAIEELTRV